MIHSEAIGPSTNFSRGTVTIHITTPIGCNLRWKSVATIAFARVFETRNWVIVRLACVQAEFDCHRCRTAEDTHRDWEGTSGDGIDVAVHVGPSVVRGYDSIGWSGRLSGRRRRSGNRAG